MEERRILVIVRRSGGRDSGGGHNGGDGKQPFNNGWRLLVMEQVRAGVEAGWDGGSGGIRSGM